MDRLTAGAKVCPDFLASAFWRVRRRAMRHVCRGRSSLQQLSKVALLQLWSRRSSSSSESISLDVVSVVRVISQNTAAAAAAATRLHSGAQLAGLKGARIVSR